MELPEALSLVLDKVQEWGRQAILLMPNLMVSLIIFALALALSFMASRVARRILGKFLSNVALVRFLGAVTRFLVLLLGLIVILNILQLQSAVLSLLTGVGIVGIALGFALQDMASNFISGVALVFRDDRPFKVGDIIETGENHGIVREINLRATTMQTFSGQYVFIPNKQIFQDAVINYSF
ncbi:MAG: mechanosensitive ion channel, partial [Chitinivibrionales bacterium]|nr:mechanosensitive ion channel [Chitinivibrionales bacterium]MBD3357686.1 mechanosensitive ion channel [Chitinivibrionales bacterium]